MPDKIQPNARVVLDYTLRQEDGDVLDASDAEGGEPIVYVHGYGMLVPGLEAGLLGLAVGASKEIVVGPAEGFGEHDEELVIEVDRSDLPNPAKVAPGDEVMAESPDGDEMPMRVVEVSDDSVVLDANHPLAGLTLCYAVKVREIALATDEEIADAAADFEDAGYGEDAGAASAYGPNNGDAPASQLVQLNAKKTPRK